MQFGNSTATCFTVDVDGKQYIVTARHALPDIEKNLTIQLQHNKEWEDLTCSLVSIGDGGIDIAVLAASHRISPLHQLEPTMNDMFLSQNVYFLGFPYGIQADVGALNADFTLPLVKKACVSMLTTSPGESNYLFLDGHSNPGFSGGPVIFSLHDKPETEELLLSFQVTGLGGTRYLCRTKKPIWR